MKGTDGRTDGRTERELTCPKRRIDSAGIDKLFMGAWSFGHGTVFQNDDLVCRVK